MESNVIGAGLASQVFILDSWSGACTFDGVTVDEVA